jgi:hypothetical protein
MRHETNRGVIGRDNNVMRVDFSRDLIRPRRNFLATMGCAGLLWGDRGKAA